MKGITSQTYSLKETSLASYIWANYRDSLMSTSNILVNREWVEISRDKRNEKKTERTWVTPMFTVTSNSQELYLLSCDLSC